MKKFLLNLLFMALMVPWITQAQAQCDGGVFMCPITVYGEDEFNDGWNGAELKVYQGTILRGTATCSGISTTTNIPVCPNDSIRLEWVAGSWDGECSFVVFSGTGDTLYFADFGDMEDVAGTIATVYTTCPSCIPPLTFSATPAGSTAINLSIGDPANSSWLLEYGEVGFTQGQGTLVEIPDTSYLLQNLNNNTSYDFYVRALCSNGDTSAALFANNRTDCFDVFPIPYADGFESYDSRPICWTYGSTYSSSYPNISTSSYVSGHKGLYMYAYNYYSNGYSSTSNIDYTYIVSPGINTTETPIQSLQVSFYMGVGTLTPTGSYPGTLIVGVMSDSSDFATFYPVDTIRNYHEGVFEELEVSFANYPTDSVNGKHIALVAKAVPHPSYTGYYLYSSIYLDDVLIRQIPDCDRPQSIECVATEATSVGIKWVDLDETHTDWEVAYGPWGFDPDSIENTQIGTIITATEDSIGIDNLMPDSIYAVYVRASCSETGEWRGPAIAIPNTYVMASGGIDTIIGCGTIIYDDGGIAYNYTNGANSTLVIFPTAEDSLVGIRGAVKLASGDILTIYSGATTTGQVLRTIVGTGTEVDVSEMSVEGPLTITFVSTESTSDDGFALKLYCIERPNCYPVTNIRTSGIAGRSALIRWDNIYGMGNGFPSGYEIEVYDLDNETIAEQDETTDNFYLVSGLDPLTNYRAKVRGVCEDGSFTPWDSVDFKTICISGGEVAVGNGTSTTSYLPGYTTYNYCYTQQIFEASELNGPSTFRSISFYQTNTSSLTRTVKVYLGQTTQSGISTTSNFVPADSLKLVYDGSHTYGQGWNTITFDSVFAYNGTSNLVFAFEDNTGTWTSGPTCRTHATTGSKAVYYFSDTQDPDPATIGSFTGSKSVVSYRNNIILGGDCDSVSGCVAPAIHIVNNTANQFDVVWAQGNTETSWNLDIKESTDTVWTSVLTGTNLTSHQFTNMTYSTVYDIRVTSVCGSETMSGIESIYIPCPAITDLPYTEDFQTWSTGSTADIDSCWNRLTNYSSGSSRYPYITTVNGSKAIYMYAPAANYSLMALPPFANNINELQMTFRAVKTTTAEQTLQLGVITDLEEIGTFVPVAQVALTEAYEWEWMDASFAGYTGPQGYLAILAPEGLATSYYVDDIEVNLIPTCPRITGVSFSNTTTTGTTVSWNSVENGSYIVEYDTIGFVPGTGIRATATDTTFALTNLTPGTFYDVYVYNVCSATDTSAPSFIETVKIPCSPMAVPFTEDFETWTASSSAEIDICWDRLSNYPTFSYYPYVTSSSTYAYSGTKSMYMYSTNTSYAALILPEFTPALNTLQLSFVAMKTSTSNYPLHIGVITDPTDISTFVPIDTVAPSAVSTHEFFEIPFNTYTGTGGRIALVSPDGVTSYPYIDDIEVNLIPTCPRPRDVASVGTHSDTIVVDWTEAGNATEWQICYGPSPINPDLGEGTIIPGVVAHPHTIPNLSNDTIYDVYVRSICGPGDTSRWSFFPETTPPMSYNMPTSGTDTVYMCSGWIFDDGGIAGKYSASANGTVIIYPSLPQNLISISGYYDGESCCDYLKVYDGAGTSGTQLYNNYGDAEDLYFESSTGPLTIQFTSDGSGQYDGFVFNVQCINNTCPRVADLTATYVTNTTAILEWTETGSATEWEIAYDTVGFDIENGGGNRVVVNTHPCTLSNLTPMTRYDVYVRGICGAEDTARWGYLKVTTGYCETPVVNEISDTVVGTTSVYPFNSYYKYSYTQQIYYPGEIDTLESGESMDISSLAFQYFYATPTSRQNVEIYFGHTTDSVFATSSSWVSDSMLTKVFEGDIEWNNEGTGNWFEIQLDTVFSYNNTDNLVVVMLDGNGAYTNSTAKLYTHTTGVNAAMVYYTDGSPINMSSPSNGTRHTYRSNIRFISCDPCPMPSGATIEPGATTAVVTFAGVGNYEISYKETEGNAWSDNISVVNASSYTVTGLQPETNYDFRLRTVCDSTTMSGWYIIPATTLELPCIAPMGFSTSNVAMTSATVAWTDSLNNQEAWKVAYGYGNDASAWDTVDVTSASVNLTDLYSNTEYTVYVKAYCSVEADVYSEWSQAFTFRTATCEGVGNITSSAVTANSATINWTPGANQTKWEIAYGIEGFNESTVTPTVVEGNPTYTITGLESDFTYDVYVRTVCAEGVTSAWSNKIQFHTTVGINTASADNVKVQIYPNPANSEATVSVDGVTGKVEFVVADMNGRMIVTETINCEGSLVKTIDVSNLAKGAYFVHIYNDNFNTTRKLIVK